MGERKGQNKYYPPDFDPKKHRSLDNYHGTHALRERAHKLHEGILIIRFEMPYNIWCEGCKKPIGMGVRYNAEKSKIGMYYTTPIYKFRMKCHLCDIHFEIKTDPAKHDYVIISGARRKEQRWDPKENEQIVPEDKDDQKRMARDAMYKMEHGVEDKNKSKTMLPAISQLATAREQWKDDYALNKELRGKFREKKKAMKLERDNDLALLNKASLEIDLVPEHADDKRMAELMKYRTVASYDEKQREKRDEINKRPLFQPVDSSQSSSSTPSSSESSTSSSHKHIKHHVAHKAITNIVSKRTDPFSVEDNKVTLSKKILFSGKSLGIVKKQKIVEATVTKKCITIDHSDTDNKTNLCEELDIEEVADNNTKIEDRNQIFSDDHKRLSNTTALNNVLCDYDTSSAESES